MVRLKIFLILIFTFQGCFDLKSKTLIVLPSEGIVMRTSPDTDAEVILTIPQKASVDLIRKDESQKVYYIDGGTVPSKWVYVQYQDRKGWVYNGYLTERYDEAKKKKKVPQEIIQGEWSQLKSVEFQDQESIKIKVYPFEKSHFKLELNPYSGIDHSVNDRTTMACISLICSVKREDNNQLFKFQILNNYEIKILESISFEMDGTRLEEIKTYKVLEEGKVYFKEQ
ncbi:SH3 domain protein [Leptospira noguchii str. 2007001578]|uniref:SH3 domain protein n=2 Tax=Leptospira noguchii TaxID=28182 RepID=A0ABP2T256_9LEPT|nr:SH3 domain protein [Leptospira noguchii str. 2007001578]